MLIKVTIVEDNDDLRESLAILINGSEGFICRHTFKSCEAITKQIAALDVDVILMDINLPRLSGIECTRHVKKLKPEIQIIMLTVYEDTDNIFESLKAGASGYLLKRTPPFKLLEAIKDVHNGGSPMSNQIARRVVQSFQQESSDSGESINLSKREMEILNCLSQGYRYREIAEKLFISMDTVRSHIRNIYEKLHVRSRTEAVLKYLKK